MMLYWSGAPQTCMGAGGQGPSKILDISPEAFWTALKNPFFPLFKNLSLKRRREKKLDIGKNELKIKEEKIIAPFSSDLKNGSKLRLCAKTSFGWFEGGAYIYGWSFIAPLRFTLTVFQVNVGGKNTTLALWGFIICHSFKLCLNRGLVLGVYFF